MALYKYVYDYDYDYDSQKMSNTSKVTITPATLQL